tara:strand:- start:287 stop:715 length:429 start_codon:yes stop_codon:yes gene_type:complete
MAIFQVIKDGVKEVVTQDSTQFSYKPDGKTKSYAVQRIMYKQNSWIPPTFVNIRDKKYLVPEWVEVHPEAQLSDVMWKRPERKVQKPDVTTKKFTSKSNPDITYTTKKTMLHTGKVQYSCNCPGVWRAKSRECKHIKEIKNN